MNDEIQAINEDFEMLSSHEIQIRELKEQIDVLDKAAVATNNKINRINIKLKDITSLINHIAKQLNSRRKVEQIDDLMNLMN